jgi:hypothetical protein
MVAKPEQATNTQLFLYLQSQILFSTFTLKSSQLLSSGQLRTNGTVSCVSTNYYLKKLHHQNFSLLLSMISEAAKSTKTSTNKHDQGLQLFAFYNQESIVGLLACLVKYDLPQTNNPTEQTQSLNSISLVKFVLALLDNNANTQFDDNVYVMLVNILKSLLLKCEPVECDKVAKEIDKLVVKENEVIRN